MTRGLRTGMMLVQMSILLCALVRSVGLLLAGMLALGVRISASELVFPENLHVLRRKVAVSLLMRADFRFGLSQSTFESHQVSTRRSRCRMLFGLVSCASDVHFEALHFPVSGCEQLLRHLVVYICDVCQRERSFLRVRKGTHV